MIFQVQKILVLHQLHQTSKWNYSLGVDGLVGLEEETSLDNLDFRRAALFLCIKLVLDALSRAEKTADRFLVLGFFLVILISFFKALDFTAFLAVLFLSFLTFFIADFMIGMSAILTQAIALLQPSLLQSYKVWLKISFLFFLPDKHQYYLEQ